MNKIISLSCLFFFLCFECWAQGQSFSLKSPDQKIRIEIRLAGKVYYQVFHQDNAITLPCPISMQLDKGINLGENPLLKTEKAQSVKNEVRPLWGKRAVIQEEYNEQWLDFGNYQLLFRAYNHGVAYRFITQIKGDIQVLDEEVSYRFPENYYTYFPAVKDLQNSFEENYQHVRLNENDTLKTAFCPVLVETNPLKVLITEADLWDYPAMNLRRRSDFHGWFHLNGVFAQHPSKVVQGGIKEFNLKVLERFPWIAQTKGERSFPWRLMLIAENDKILADNDLVYLLSSPSQINSADWIKPGKVAWDWYNANNLSGVDFKTGINTRTYQYYIDFASKAGLEYVILDEGWSNTHDLMMLNPEMDVPGLVQYAAERNVGIILWCVWHTLDRQMEAALNMFSKWGVKGVKVDFMDRDDQVITQFYEKIAKATAQKKLLLDFHGCGKPTGMSRTYPNILNYEGVLGNEFNKWSSRVSPDHNLLIPFIRMAAGVMDYTPGAMRNASLQNFRPIFEQPMSQGTRCHQLAMYVIYEAGLQMLCDAPTAYEKDLMVLDYLSKVPVSWDESKVLEAKLGDYLVIARKKGNYWYIAGMNDWTPREIEINLSDLKSTFSEIELFADGLNSEKNASDYQYKKIPTGSTLKIKMAPGGGFVLKCKIAG